MAKPLRLLLFEGPGGVDRFRAALISRQWSLLVNTSEEECGATWPSLRETWRKKQVARIDLHGPDDPAAESEGADQTISGSDWQARVITDELRPSRRMVIVETAQIVVGIGAGTQGEEPPPGRQRALVIDAGWTHVPSFPDREDVRSYLAGAIRSAAGRVHFVTDLPWDVRLFESVARELGRESAAHPVLVGGSTGRKLWLARQILPQIDEPDTVLIGLVPGRDERGLFQRLRSDFAEKTSSVRAFPTAPLSTGPGQSRDEALESVGLWLPTRVLIAAGPISEQVLLARHLEESTRGSPVTVGVAGGEYRLPDFDLIRNTDAGHRVSGAGRQRGVASRAGLVVVTYGRDENAVSLSGTGLADNVQTVLPKIHVNRRGKTPEQLVREVEMAFTSRGLPVPAVRFLG